MANYGVAYNRLDEVYFDLASRVEGVEGLLGWKDQEMVDTSVEG